MMRSETIAKSIVDKLSEHLTITEQKKEILIYGAILAITSLTNLLFTFFFGYLFNVLIEALIFTITTAILRKYSGGFHASTSTSCVILGIVSTITLAKLSELSWFSSYLPEITFLSILLCFLCNYIFFTLAPVDSPAKPITNPQKKKQLSKKSILFLNAFFLVYFICILVFVKLQNPLYLKFSLCILFGVGWQGFTLTPQGHWILSKIDRCIIFLMPKRGSLC